MTIQYIYKKVLTLLLIITLGSCNYLDVVPDNIATIDNAFSNRNNAEKFLATCYSYIPPVSTVHSNPGLLSGDEVWINKELIDLQPHWEPAVNISKGIQNTNDPFINYWEGRQESGKNLFIGIRDCNIFLDEIGNVKDITNDERKLWIAEVKFLKAFYHFWLFRCYGPIPIIDNNLPIHVETKDVQIYRDPVNDVVDFIVNTIDEAIFDLPMTILSETSELGRITKPIAMAIKAKVLITAASPLFNGNSDFANLTDNRGLKLFDSSYDPNKWKLAADAALSAIEACESVGIELTEEFRSRQNHSDAIQKILTLQSVVTTRETTEIIWAATGRRIASGQQSSMQPLLVSVTDANPTTQYYAATLKMAEMFYTKNGLPISEDKDFDYTNRYKVRTALAEENDFVRSGEQTAILHFDREPRFYASLAFDRGTYVLDPNYYYVQIRSGELASKRNTGRFSATGYFPKKLISPSNSFAGNNYLVDYSYPFPMIRLADLYLLYAEALNEVKSSPDNEVYEYIDKVRERAGIPNVLDSWQQFSDNPSKPTTKDGMRDIIHKERMIELVFEGPRFWDLRRWKLSEKYMNQPVQGWSIQSTGLDYYNVSTLFTPTFGFKDYLWPIRESEILKNPNLVQNPGW